MVIFPQQYVGPMLGEKNLKVKISYSEQYLFYFKVAIVIMSLEICFCINIVVNFVAGVFDMELALI